MIISEDINTVSEYYEPDTSNAMSQPVSTDTSFVIMLSTFMNDHHMFTVMFTAAPYPLGLGAVQWAGSPHTQQDKQIRMSQRQVNDGPLSTYRPSSTGKILEKMETAFLSKLQKRLINLNCGKVQEYL